jgi:hypothetical protein
MKNCQFQLVSQLFLIIFLYCLIAKCRNIPNRPLSFFYIVSPFSTVSDRFHPYLQERGSGATAIAAREGPLRREKRGSGATTIGEGPPCREERGSGAAATKRGSVGAAREVPPRREERGSIVAVAGEVPLRREERGWGAATATAGDGANGSYLLPSDLMISILL